ncbi:MAG: hypothetical protein HKL80_02960 [Acidimicrobiales bacterium]|nr:hypothetical protein [Acidimicrobiales bacterium]
MSVRIVAGSLKGRTLKVPVAKRLAGSNRVRPTTSKVREAVFSMLLSMLGEVGGFGELTVLDLYAGSGALGFEAISRGAKKVIFVDSSGEATKEIIQASKVFGVDELVEVHRVDAIDYLRSHSKTRGSKGFGLVFADPPYTFSEWEKLLEYLNCDIAVLESNGSIGDLARTFGFNVSKERNYGTTFITVVRQEDSKIEG